MTDRPGKTEFCVGDNQLMVVDGIASARRGESVCIHKKFYTVVRVGWVVDYPDEPLRKTLVCAVYLKPVA